MADLHINCHFPRESWFFVLLLFVVLALFLVPYAFYFNATMPKIWSNRLVVLSGWLAFLLVHAYYSGALTMFLSSESAPPFEKAWDGLKLYPEWKMVSYPGAEIVIQPLGERLS